MAGRSALGGAFAWARQEGQGEGSMAWAGGGVPARRRFAASVRLVGMMTLEPFDGQEKKWIRT